MEHLDLIRTVRAQQAEVAHAIAARMVAAGVLPPGSMSPEDVVFPLLVDHIQAVIRCVSDGEPIPETGDETTQLVREFFLHHWGPVQPLGTVRDGRLDLDFDAIARWRKHFP